MILNKKSQSKGKEHHFVYVFSVLILLFSFITICIYAHKIGKMGIKDIFHFWDFISECGGDWDTFSALISAILGSAFSAITLLFLVVEHYNSIREKQELELQKEQEKKEVEKEKEEERRLHQKEKENLEKDKLTIRFIEDMERLNAEFQDLGLYGKKPLFEIYKDYNENFEKQIYTWIFLQDLQLNGHSIFDKYKELQKQFPIVTSAFNDTIETIDWESFKKHHNGLETFLLKDIKLTEDLKTEILENCGENYSKEKWRQINELIVPRVLYNTKNDVLNNLLSRMIEHFFFAMRSLLGYQEGINYYFLQLSEEQRYFFRFITSDEEISKCIKDAIIKTESLKNDRKYWILKFLDKN